MCYFWRCEELVSSGFTGSAIRPDWTSRKLALVVVGLRCSPALRVNQIYREGPLLPALLIAKPGHYNNGLTWAGRMSLRQRV